MDIYIYIYNLEAGVSQPIKGWKYCRCGVMMLELVLSMCMDHMC